MPSSVSRSSFGPQLIPMSDGYVNSSTEGGIATIIFHHPKSNSLPGHILRGIADAITTAGKDPGTRVIILRSDGDKAFCAGASFDELVAIEDEARIRGAPAVF